MKMAPLSRSCTTLYQCALCHCKVTYYFEALARGFPWEIEYLDKQEIRSVELGVCSPMQLFHFWSRDVHPFQNLLLCTKFHENHMIFTEIWRHIDFQNDGRPPSWNCFTTIRDHPQVCVAGRSCLSNFMSIWYTDLKTVAIRIFRIFGLKCPFRPQNRGLGDFGSLNVIIHHRDPQKIHLCVNFCL